ncbi:MAG: c-type heme family protein [Erythrobacter sp.]
MNLKLTALTSAAVLALAACSSEPAEPVAIDKLAVAERAKPIAADFSGELVGTLQAAIAAGGPVEGVEVCYEAASAIAASHSEESGAQIRRIADRHRNPAGGVPDEARLFYNELAAQPMADGGPASRIWTSGSGNEAKVHFLSAIPMKDQPCGVCHGTNIQPALQAKIDELYPEDAATGFSEGDLRGALWITWPASVFAVK